MSEITMILYCDNCELPYDVSELAYNEALDEQRWFCCSECEENFKKF